MRRLPVINSTAPEDDAAAARPRWQWILIGMGFTGAFWIPVALLVLAVTTAVPVLGAISALPLIATYALAAAGAGAVMGRFAPRSPPGDAAWAAAFCAAALAVASSSPRSALPALFAFVALAPVGALAAFLASRRMRPAVPRGGST